MAEICFVCKGEKSGKVEEFYFEHNGFKLRTTKLASECRICKMRLFLEGFRRYEGKLVARADGKLVVDWQFYLRSKNSHYCFGEINDILLALGVFSHSAEGNWEIIAEGPIGLNPRTGAVGYVFFARKEDAVAYAQLKLSKTLCYWEIRHIDCVIPKAKALEF